MSSPETPGGAGPRDVHRLAGREPSRQGATHKAGIGEHDDATCAQPTTAWADLGFDQALATRCASYGWTAHRVSEYLCRDHGNADPFDTILNGCDPLEALAEHETGGPDK